MHNICQNLLKKHSVNCQLRITAIISINVNKHLSLRENIQTASISTDLLNRHVVSNKTPIQISSVDKSVSRRT